MAKGFLDGSRYVEGHLIVNLSEAARLLDLCNYTISKRLSLGNVRTFYRDNERLFFMKDIMRPGERAIRRELGVTA